MREPFNAPLSELEQRAHAVDMIPKKTLDVESYPVGDLILEAYSDCTFGGGKVAIRVKGGPS